MRLVKTMFDRIVVATDFSERSKAAHDAAAQIAHSFGASQVHLLHILDTGLGGAALPYGPLQQETEDAFLQAEAKARAQLEEIELAPEVGHSVCEVRRGEPAFEIALYADEIEADLVVMATQGRSAIGRTIIGSVTSGVLGYTHCPVLVTSATRRPFRTIEQLLVAVDLSPVSTAVLQLAARIAEQTSARVRVHSVHQRPFIVPGEHPMYYGAVSRSFEIKAEEQHRRTLDALLDKVVPNMEAEVSVKAAREAHQSVLDVESALRPSLTLIGSSGIRTWGRRIFGTNAEKISARAQGPLLVVPDQLRRGLEPEANPTGELPAPTKRHPDEQLVYAIFATEAQVRAALQSLTDAQIGPDDISVVTKTETFASKFNQFGPRDQAFAAGGSVGASVGAILGGLASFGAVSGVGLMIVGPAIALGLAGGLIASLLGLGVPAHEARRLQQAVDAGGTIVAVHAHDFAALQTAKEAFAKLDATPKRLSLQR